MYAGSSFYTNKYKKITSPLYLSFVDCKVGIIIFKVGTPAQYIYIYVLKIKSCAEFIL